MDKKTFIKFNVNHYVWVKLTEQGIAVLLKYKNKYAKHVGETTMDEILKWYDVTDDGYYRFQMHAFMEIFGDGVITRTLFETNVYFDPAELLVPVPAPDEQPEPEKYITTEIPSCEQHGESIAWWAPKHAPKVIKELERKNPGYDFHQFVTSPGNGGYREYAIMKLKDK